MPPDEPGMATVIRLPVKYVRRVPELRRGELRVVARPPPRRKPRSAWRTAGWALATLLGVFVLLVMLVLSVSEPLEGRGEAPGEAEASTPFQPSGVAPPDLSGPAWVSTPDSSNQ